MKKVIIAIMAIATALANVERINAQETEQLLSSEISARVRRIISKANISVNGDTLRNKGIVSEAAVRSDFYDKKKFTAEVPVDSGMTAEVTLDKGIRRIILSKGSIGFDLGYLNIGGISTLAAGAHATMAWKRVSITPGFLLGRYEMNQESNRPGEGYWIPMAYVEGGINIRSSLGKYDNHQLFELGVGVMYVFKRNSNEVSSKSYIINDKLITEKSEFMVEGNATSFYVYAKWRFAFKHFAITGGSLKAMVGMTREYKKYGSESQIYFGGGVSFDVCKSRKHIDRDVEWLQNSLEMGNQRVANEFVNQLRATVK